MVKILIAQLNPVIGDIEGNEKKIMASLGKEHDFDIALFPEMTLTGYMPQDLIFESSFLRRHQLSLERLTQFAKDKLVIIGGIDSSDGEKPFYNSAFLLHEGKIQAKYHKMCLPTYDVFDEKRYFSEGTHSLVYDFQGKKIAVTICEDMWAAENEVQETHYSHHPFSTIGQVDIIVNLTASPYVMGKAEKRLEIISSLAKKHQSFFFYACQVGGNDGVIFDGGSLVVDPEGKFVKQLSFFQEDIEVVNLENYHTSTPKFLPIQEEIENALILGFKDFFHKQGFTSCLIGLSGGIDSALTCYLAQKALGSKHVKAFMIPSLFTSNMSIEDAQIMANNLQIEIGTAPLGKVLKEIEDMVNLQTKVAIKDLTHQNMQARLRGLFLMAMSNQTNALVIATGNKSELAMGYSTLYGDMCGAIAPIGDLYKTQVYELVKAIQKKEKVFPERMILRAPSAELYFNQVDEDTLPPYPILDELIRLVIEENYSAEKISLLKKFEPEIVKWVVKKIYSSEFKRQQFCPILKVSKKTFGTGRKMPIVQKFV